MHLGAWVVATLLGALAVTGCTSEPPDPPGAGPTSPSSAPTSSGREDVAPVVAPMRASEVRWARGNVPRSVPGIDDQLPSVLVDPPGRALVASYVPRRTYGWSGESVELYGVDGRWRRLRLGDLDLPASGWHGGDTYGAGALSPDGRWWAGAVLGGFFLLDLRDGTLRLPEPIGRRYGTAGMPSFRWSPDGQQLVVVIRGRATRVDVADLHHAPFPRPRALPLPLSGGGWIECGRSGEVARTCTTYAPDGTVTEDRDVPPDLRRGRWSGPIAHVAGGLWVSAARNAYGNLHHDWEVVLTDDDLRARSRLVLPAGSEINGVGDALAPTTLGLAAYGDRLLLAFLADSGEVVRLLRPGRLTADMGYNFWDVAFAEGLLEIG